ncbi:MAG: glycosyltransferase [Cellulosilyticaceae bacterium]
MKVLQINSVCGVGSTGRIATDLHNILEENGHESYIAYGRGTAQRCNKGIKIGSRVDNYFHVAQTRLFDRHGLGSYYATKKLIKQIDEFNPDVIHLHNIHGYYINIKILFEYIKKVNKPVVWTLHDCWAFTGHCSHFDYIGCNKWKSECNKCNQKKQYPSSLIKDRSKKNYQLKKDVFKGVENMTIVTPSEWLAEIVKKSFLNEYEVKVINNGIDLEIFKPIESNFKKKQDIEGYFIILGVASVWNKRKGMEYFLELSNEIEKDEKIVLVGVTEKQKKELPENVIGITRTNNIEELAKIYSMADVFVNPTLEDNFPTTNLEALACGTPVITFNTGGSVESIDDMCGVVLDKNESGKLLMEIRKCYKNKKSKEKCIVKSTQYDKNVKNIEYINIYKMISKEKMKSSAN